MIRLRHKLLILFFRVFDQLVVALCLSTALGHNTLGQYLGISAPETQSFESTDILALLALFAGSVILFHHLARYDANRFTSVPAQIIGVIKATTASTFLLLVVGVLFGVPQLTTREIAVIWAVSTVTIAASRYFINLLLCQMRRSGFSDRHLLIVGTNAGAYDLAAKFESTPELGYKILGFVLEPGGDPTAAKLPAHSKWTLCGSFEDLKSLLEHNTVDEVLICLPFDPHAAKIAYAVKLSEELGIVARVIASQKERSLLRRMQFEYFDGDLVLTFFRENLLLQLMAKRLLDVLASFILIVLLSPLLLVVALLVKFTSPGPVFFIQERVGMNKRRFRLYKFRSMVVDAEARKRELAHLNEMDGPVFKIKKDPRITPIGRFIRRTSIDELPQLFNVLRGTMSLVGPRPPVPSEVEKYEWLFQRRLSIKPGITCLWQISGRNEVSFKEWMELDKQYVESWSLWLDVKILFRTVPVVLFGRGAS